MEIIVHKNDDKNISRIDALGMIPSSSVWLANFISRRTKKTYANAVKDFVKFAGIGSDADWTKISAAHVIAWRDNMIQQEASPRTVNAHLSALSSLFNHLCENRIAEKNPVTGIRRPKVTGERVETPVITANQVRAMLDAPDRKTLKGMRDRALLHVMFYTGCRISEACSLKVKNFYEDAGYLVLDFTIKGGRKNKIAIHQECKNALNRYLIASGHWQELQSPLILAVKRPWLRRHLTATQVNRIFHKYAKETGLPRGVTPHTARATFITEALENRCSLEAVKNSVGHVSISTTQRYDKRIIRHRESASFKVDY